MGIKIGCAGWALQKAYQMEFAAAGSHLARYSQVFTMVEINSCFYRYHKPETYARWAASTPDGFEFALKIPKVISHEQKLKDCEEAWLIFQRGFTQLGNKLGPILLQLPPSQKFQASTTDAFFGMVRDLFKGHLICEPRHPSWFSEEAAECLQRWGVARVAADPALLPEAARPLLVSPIAYYRLHGSPVMYASNYEDPWLDRLCATLQLAQTRAERVYCVFDNTSLGCATANGLHVVHQFSGMPRPSIKSPAVDLNIPPV